jgi:hypothetical protein
MRKRIPSWVGQEANWDHDLLTFAVLVALTLCAKVIVEKGTVFLEICK